jgi:alkanesulfonate monooxygenase SsuD/methylene tetrahydromethanopterin reductase-like flavin-dependent oxidoreductase (luciferase family)
VKDKPQPVRQPIPILIGGEGEQVTLRLAAQSADIWNSGASPENFKHKNSVLDQWCEKVGRDPDTIERSVNIYGKPELGLYDAYLEAGARHLILNVGAPWDLGPVEQLVEWKQKIG